MKTALRAIPRSNDSDANSVSEPRTRARHIPDGGQALKLDAFERAAITALGAIAQVLEEPDSSLCARDLKQLCQAHSQIWRVVFGDVPDYLYRDGAVLVRRSGDVIKRAIDGGAHG